MKNFLRALKLPDFRRFHRAARFSAGSKARSARGSIGELSSTTRPRPKAYRLYLEELERLPEAMLKKDRAVEHYLHIAMTSFENDHQEHQRQMDGRSGCSGRSKRRRMYTKSAWLGCREKEAGLKRNAKAERAQWALDTFSDHRSSSQRSIDHLFRTRCDSTPHSI